VFGRLQQQENEHLYRAPIDDGGALAMETARFRDIHNRIPRHQALDDRNVLGRTRLPAMRWLMPTQRHSLDAWASADGVWRPTIAGASWTSSSFSRVSTMNSAKSTRRVMLLARMGSPTCRLHTGRP
jgi:hypothetical protein